MILQNKSTTASMFDLGFPDGDVLISNGGTSSIVKFFALEDFAFKLFHPPGWIEPM